MFGSDAVCRQLHNWFQRNQASQIGFSSLANLFKNVVRMNFENGIAFLLL